VTDPLRASATRLGVVVLLLADDLARRELGLELDAGPDETGLEEPVPPEAGGGGEDDGGEGGGGGDDGGGAGDGSGSVTGGGGGGGVGGGLIEIVVVVIGVETVTVGSVGRLIAPKPGPVATAASTPAAASATPAANPLSRLPGRTSLQLISGVFGCGRDAG
jgi:hypothetical protein